MKLPTLEILISTNSLPAFSAMSLPQEEGVSYLISWQKNAGLEAPQRLLDRRDVRIVRNPGSGLSQNRNHALDHASGDILLIADDDLIYRPGAFRKIREAFASHPGLDIGLFRYECGDGRSEKTYPEEETVIKEKLPKGYFVSSIEIAIRRKGRSGHLRFDPKFGLGAPVLGAGEEEVFLHHALKSGHEVRFFPTTICTHPGETTGLLARIAPAALRGIGATILLLYPVSWAPRLLLKAWRISRSGQGGFFGSLRSLTHGAFYGMFNIEKPWKSRRK